MLGKSHKGTVGSSQRSKLNALWTPKLFLIQKLLDKDVDTAPSVGTFFY